jgi:hypothetical protein
MDFSVLIRFRERMNILSQSQNYLFTGKTMQLTALYTLIRKELIRIIRIWPQTILPPVITQTLYFVIFGGFI